MTVTLQTLPDPKVYSRLNDAIKRRKDANIIISKDKKIDDRYVKEFCLFDDIQTFRNYLKITNKPTHFYEIYEVDKPCCYVQDLDITDPKYRNIEHVKTIVDTTTSYLMEYCKEQNLNIRRCEVRAIVLESPPTEKKASYHVIYRIKDVYFADNLICKNFYQWMTKIKKCVLVGLDDSMYGKNKQLRLYNSSKMEYPENKLKIHKDFYVPKDVLETMGTYTPIKEGVNFLRGKTLTKEKKKELLEDALPEPLIPDKIKYLLDGLDENRYTERNKWLNVGYILKGINEKNIDYYHYFSKKWDKYVKDEVEYTWDSLHVDDYKLTDLIHLYNLDNKVSFGEEVSKDIESVDSHEVDIAEFIKICFNNKFVCSSPEHNEYYYFNGIYYQKENGNTNLRYKITQEIRPLFNQARYTNKRASKIYTILSKGQKPSYLDVVFYDKDFNKKINNNPNFLCFKNGVYELNTLTFRQGMPNDYITMCTAINFDDSFNDFDEITKFLKDIFIDNVVFRWMMKMLAGSLYGRNIEEFFYMWVGTGANGKSLLEEVIKYAMGEYYATGRVSIITSNRSSSDSANSALLSLNHKRFVFFNEPNHTDKINSGMTKDLTDGVISVRGLYKDEQTMVCSFSPILTSQNLIDIPDTNDGGLRRRIKIIEFKTKFVEKDKIKKPYHRERNNDIKKPENLERLGKAFLHYIIKKWLPLYNKEGISKDIPDSINEYTNQYMDEQDTIKQFIKDHIIEDSSSYFTKKQLKDYYNAWESKQTMKQNVFFTKIANELDSRFIDRKKINGKEYTGIMMGYSLKEKDDDGLFIEDNLDQ